MAEDNNKVGRVEEPEVSPLKLVLRDPNFLAVWLVGGLTGIVRWLQLLVLGLYTFEITGSALLVSVVPMLWMLPLALCGPAFGVLADRANRKLLLLGALSGIISISIWMSVLASLGDPSFVHIAAMSLLSGLFWATDMPVRRRLLGDLAGDSVASAMSLDSATGNATRMAGPLLGGAVLEFFSFAGVFFFSTAIYALCIALIALTSLARAPCGGRGELLSRTQQRPRLCSRKSAASHHLCDHYRIQHLGISVYLDDSPSSVSNTLSLSPLLVGVLSGAEGLGALLGALTIAVIAKPKAFFWIYLGGTARLSHPDRLSRDIDLRRRRSTTLVLRLRHGARRDRHQRLMFRDHARHP